MVMALGFCKPTHICSELSFSLKGHQIGHTHIHAQIHTDLSRYARADGIMHLQAPECSYIYTPYIIHIHVHTYTCSYMLIHINTYKHLNAHT